jgi:hypothetical protein
MDIGDFIAKLLNKQPENKVALYLVYYPLVGVSMLAALYLIAFVLPELAAWAWGISILLLPIAGVLCLAGFLIKKWLLS